MEIIEFGNDIVLREQGWIHALTFLGAYRDKRCKHAKKRLNQINLVLSTPVPQLETDPYACVSAVRFQLQKYVSYNSRV